jgi:hypothetical protein
MIHSEKILLSPPAPALAAPAGPVPDDGLFWESRIAAEVGISRERLRSLRDAHMTEDTHFIRKKNAVVLTISGLDKLHALLAPAAPTAAPVEKIAPSPGPVPRLAVRVVKVPGNARLLLCLPPTAAAGAQPLIVRVKTNENFMAGMTLEVISAGENCYQYLGRLPRRHGRW